MFNLWNYIPHFFHALSLKSYHAGSSWDCDWNGNEICSLTPMFRWFLLFQGVIFDLWTPACSATVSDTITSTRTHLHLLKRERFGLFCSILFFPHLFLRCQHLNKCRGKLLCLDSLWCGNTQKMQYYALPCPLGVKKEIKQSYQLNRNMDVLNRWDLHSQALVTGNNTPYFLYFLEHNIYITVLSLHGPWGLRSHP